MLRCATVAILLLAASAAGAAPDASALRSTEVGARAYERGALEEALAALEDAHEREPADTGGRKNLALVLARMAEQAIARRDGPAAVALLDRALELHPGRLHYERLRGRALLRAGRAGDALRAAQFLTTVSPAYARAWLLLADVQERSGNLASALEALEHAGTLRPDDDGLRRHMADIRTRADAEAHFLSHGTGHFVVKYDPDVDPGLVELALTLLEDAYARVTAELGIVPRTPAGVVLYDGAEFQRVTGAHSWVGALYQNGVLRVPVRNLQRHRDTAARVLAHEFTHHVLKERTPALPVWWHEGIAQFVEADAAAGALRRRELAELLRAQKARSRMLTLDEMQRTTISRVRNAGTVQLFYAQAHAFTGWLADRQGAGALPSFLTALGTGSDIDAACKRAFGASTHELYAAWAESL